MKWRILFVFAATALSLGAVLWALDPTDSLAALHTFRPSAAIIPVLLLLLTLLMRTARYRALLNHPMQFRPLLAVVAVSFLAINVVPLRMGELVRPYLLADRYQVPFGTAMAAVVLERVMDVLALLVTLLIVGWLVHIPAAPIQVFGLDLLSAALRTVGILAGVGLVGLAAVIAAGRRGVDVTTHLMRRLSPHWADLFQELGYRFVDGVRILLSEPTRAAIALANTAAMWALSPIAVGLTMGGFPDIEPTIERVLFNWGATISAITLFPTPGFFGPFEAASVGSLVLTDVDASQAATFALVLHALMFGFIATSGLGFMLREGWSLMALVQRSRGATS